MTGIMMQVSRVVALEDIKVKRAFVEDIQRNIAYTQAMIEDYEIMMIKNILSKEEFRMWVKRKRAEMEAEEIVRELTKEESLS